MGECENELSQSQVELPCWELESQWTPKTSESNCKGQNPSPWRVFYIIGNLLKRRCPKWARMTYLNIYNTSYGPKKGRESNWQVDSRPGKVKNQPDSLVCKWRATRCWKALDEGYNFSLDLIPIGGLHKKLWVPGQKAIKTSLPRGGAEYTTWGKVVASLESRPWWILWVQGCLWLVLTPKVFQPCANQLVCWFCAGLREWVNCLSLFLIPSRSSNTPLYPSKMLRARECAPSP